VGLLTNNFGDWRKSKDFMRQSPELAKKPMGEFIDPDKVLTAKIICNRLDEIISK
jgi:hypothetical protein